MRTLLIISLCWRCMGLHAETTTYFGTNTFQPVGIEHLQQSGVKIDVYNLDAPLNFENEVSKDLPLNNVELATEIARSRVAKYTEQQMKDLFMGAFTARKWEIQQLPAVVFEDGKFAIYGMTNIGQAYQIYRSKRGAQ